MSTVDLRSEIIDCLQKVKDESFLKVVHSMLDTYVMEQKNNPIIGYDIDGTPRSASELTKILDKEVEKAKRGEFMTIEAFQKESAKWGQPTK